MQNKQNLIKIRLQKTKNASMDCSSFNFVSFFKILFCISSKFAKSVANVYIYFILENR